MDPRPSLQVERARREARERKLRLIQVALGRTPGGGPVGWAKRFEQQRRAANAASPGSLRDATPTEGGAAGGTAGQGARRAAPADRAG